MDQPILNTTEHLPVINAGMAEAQKILDECLRAERCKIGVDAQKADAVDALEWLRTLKAEYFPDET